jgi:lipopolysaccharide transport protein LptA/LPS export ABC transporter protein LptC
VGLLRDRVKHDPARALRLGLLGLVLLVSAAVAWSLLRPAPRSGSVAPSVVSTGTTVADMSFLRFRDDSRKIEVKAREMVREQGDAMLMHGVEASLPFVGQGRPGIMTIRADECQYQPGLERAAFKGNVSVRTDDGFELDTDTLKYWGDKQRAFTRDPLRFKRGALSGTATGLEYRAGSGILLQDSVRVRIEDGAGPPTEVESQSATASREQRVIGFAGAVIVRQAARELKSASLRLDMSEDMQAVERATATGDVDLVAGAGAPLPGSTAPGSGTRRLRSQKLEVVFRAKGVLQEAVATGAASLEIEPGPSEARERRRVSGPRLRFDFDAEGRLLSVQGPRGTSAGARDRSLVHAEPLDPAAGVARRVESDSFVATLDPVTGAVQEAVFEGSVAFEEPGRKAWAGHSAFDAAAGMLVLTRDPRIQDEAEGSELRGREIRVHTRTSAVWASGNVRHTVAGKKGGGTAGLLGGGQEPTTFICREFEYDPGTRTARYRENALVRSGTDEVRAPLITLDQAAPGRRRMTATGGTASVLHPRPAKEAVEAPAAVEARSREMQYEEEKNRIVYTGDVEIRQGDILTRSPEAIVLLTKDGESVDRLLAGEPVEVYQGVRRATGERGTYTPASETFVLTGEKVVLYDVDRRLEGRILTFEAGSDRIRVDGREEVRTEAVFRRKQAPQP